MKYPNTRKSHESLLLIIPFLILLVPLLVGNTFPGTFLPASSASLQGDVERGRRLFMGTLHLENGGPPCMGCHNIDNQGLLGGGALGPDLTDVSSRYSSISLAEAMASIPWPTMAPIFNDHPLTPQEQADLQAFLEASAGQPTSNREPFLWGLSLGGLAAAAGLFGIYYRRRLRSIRGKLVRQAQSSNQDKYR